jgi:hypothetical protein
MKSEKLENEAIFNPGEWFQFCTKVFNPFETFLENLPITVLRGRG